MSFVIPSIFSAIDGLTAPVRSMMRTVSAFAANADTAGARANRAFNKIGNGADRAFNALNPLNKINGALAFTGVTIGAAGAATALGKFVTEASKIEDATARFGPLMGSLAAAEDLVQKLNIAGAQTPYEFADIADIVANMLPALKGNANKALEIFNMIGDTAGGNVDRLNRVALGYNKTLLKQKVTLEGLNIIAEAGVPIFQVMAKVMYGNADATAKLFKAISDGKVPMQVLEKSFEQMTSNGGLYYMSMIKASKTFSGIMSTLRDNVNMTFASIGKAMLPTLKEIAIKLIGTTQKIQEWAIANKGLIKTKIEGWIASVINVVKFLYKNFDTIITVTKIYVGTLIVLKAASMAFAIAQGIVKGVMIAYNVVLGISTAMQGKSAFFVMGNTVAYGAYRAAIVAATAGQWLLNAAMAANPIGVTILALAALIAIVVVAVKHYKDWGATLLWFLGPIGRVVSAFKSIYDNWDMIKNAWSTDGMIGALKALGAVLLDVILLPLQQILTLMGNLPGAVGRAANNAASNIADLRASLGTGPSQPGGTGVNSFTKEFYPVINPKAPNGVMQEQTINKNTTNKQQVEVLVKAEPGTSASVVKNLGPSMPNITSTMGFGK